MSVTLIRMAFLGLLTALGLVCSTYAADITRQSSTLNSSMTKRLELVTPRNTFELLVNGTRSARSPLVSSAFLALNLSADPDQHSSGYPLLPEANMVPQCDKSLGENLKRTSCSSALLRITINDKVHKVAQRGRGVPGASYLPLRWLSRESSPTDGIIDRDLSLKSSIVAT